MAAEPGFELVAGPLKTLHARAAEDPGHDYFMIIDELNRGNVAKVFGELYFLLEYRDEPRCAAVLDRGPSGCPTNLP